MENLKNRFWSFWSSVDARCQNHGHTVQSMVAFGLKCHSFLVWSLMRCRGSRDFWMGCFVFWSFDARCQYHGNDCWFYYSNILQVKKCSQCVLFSLVQSSSLHVSLPTLVFCVLCVQSNDRLGCPGPVSQRENNQNLVSDSKGSWCISSTMWCVRFAKSWTSSIFCSRLE